jgi:excisionase family DNA binding protein
LPDSGVTVAADNPDQEEHSSSELLWEQLLTVKEVSKMLRVSINTVRIWSDSGVLPCYRIGPRGDRRFLVKDVRRFLGLADKRHG